MIYIFLKRSYDYYIAIILHYNIILLIICNFIEIFFFPFAIHNIRKFLNNLRNISLLFITIRFIFQNVGQLTNVHNLKIGIACLNNIYVHIQCTTIRRKE